MWWPTSGCLTHLLCRARSGGSASSRRLPLRGLSSLGATSATGCRAGQGRDEGSTLSVGSGSMAAAAQQTWR